MWSDSEAAVDLLNVEHLVAAITETVTRNQLRPLTLGVFGDWGSGKSSVVTMAKRRIEQDYPKVLCVYFNGWLFEGYEDAKAAILGTILDELADKRMAREKAKLLFAKLLARIKWLRLMGWGAKAYLSYQAGLPPVDAANAASAVQAGTEALEEIVKEAPEGEENIRRTIRNFQKDFSELLRQTEVEAVVVFIDDLDRCLPGTVIDTLEAIRLFVFVPEMAFVIGADERLIKLAVGRHFPEFLPAPHGTEPAYTQQDVSREYLEKLIQIPIHVPPLSRAEIATYVNLLFAELHLEPAKFIALSDRARGKLRGSFGTRPLFTPMTAAELLGEEPPDALKEDLALASQISDVLATSVAGNPRQTKRFLNALLLRLRMAEVRGVELNRRMAAKLMLLEYYRPTLFRLLGTWQAQQDGRPEELATLESAIRVVPDVEKSGPAQDSDAGEAGEERRGSRQKPRADVGGRKQQDVELPPELATWVADPWVREWLALDPSLLEVDLGPFFYFARERTGMLAAAAERMSPLARRILSQFITPSLASHKAAARAAKDLSVPEASSVFSALADAVQRTETLDASGSPLYALFELVGARSELAPQFAMMLQTLPVNKVSVGWPPRVVEVLMGGPGEVALRPLLEGWAQSPNSMLAQAATRSLQRLTDSTPRREDR